MIDKYRSASELKTSARACQVALSFNGNFPHVFWKGYVAKANGKPRSANPYHDVRNTKGHPTFSRGYRNTWDLGWEWAERDGQ